MEEQTQNASAMAQAKLEKVEGELDDVAKQVAKVVANSNAVEAAIAGKGTYRGYSGEDVFLKNNLWTVQKEMLKQLRRKQRKLAKQKLQVLERISPQEPSRLVGEASSIDSGADIPEANGGKDQLGPSASASNAYPAVMNGADSRSNPVALQSNVQKRKCGPDEKEESIRPQQQRKTPARKSGGKKAFSRIKEAPSKSEVGKGKSKSSLGTSNAEAAKMNPHRAKILVGKQALAVIKSGTRLYIKSGEGNGGDTWWDSGVIEKIHERGKPYEIEWGKFNNRGEEVDTGVEKRIILPVTYSLAGVAAEAIKTAAPGSEAAARKRVLADARIGSWCISHPEEPWGTLDPFISDSTPVLDSLLARSSA